MKHFIITLLLSVSISSFAQVPRVDQVAMEYYFDQDLVKEPKTNNDKVVIEHPTYIDNGLFLKFEIDSVVQVPNQSADQIYDKLESWISAYFGDSREAIEYRSKETKSIHGSGNFVVPVKVVVTYKGIVPFDFDIKVKDNRFKIYVKAEKFTRYLNATDEPNVSLYKEDSNVFYSQKKWDAFRLDVIRQMNQMIADATKAATNTQSDW
jgi:hypothetical protein